MTEGTGTPEVPQGEVHQGIKRRDFLKGGTIAVGIGAGVVAALAIGKHVGEKILPRPAIERSYRIGEDDVILSGQDFLPRTGEVVNPQEAVVFLVGAPMRAQASVTWEQPRQLADQFKVRAYTLDARPQGMFEGNSLDLEVEALRQFIAEAGLKKVTIFGHSISAVKAVNLVAVLEQLNPDIEVNGAVLANPMGFYPQDASDLFFRRYPAEVGSESKLVNPKTPHENPVKTGIQLLGSVAADIKQTKLGYLKWFREQVQALTVINPNFGKIKAPVVLLLGEKDLLSEVENVLPKEEIEKRMTASIPDEQLRGWIESESKWEHLPMEEQQKFGSKEDFTVHYMQAYRKQEDMVRRGKARNEYLGGKVIVATKHASHIGFTVERVDQTAHVVSGIFDRLRRTKKSY